MSKLSVLIGILFLVVLGIVITMILPKESPADQELSGANSYENQNSASQPKNGLKSLNINNFGDAEEDEPETYRFEKQNKIRDFRGLLGNDIFSEGAYINELDDLELQYALSEEFLEHWSTADPRRIYDWFLRNEHLVDPEEREELETLILHELALVDPDKAAGFIEQLTNKDQRDELLVGLAEGLVKRNHQEAFDWIASLSGSDVSAGALRDCYSVIMHEYMNEEPIKAAEAIASLESESLQRELARSLISRLGEQDVLEALDWGQSLISESVQLSVINELIYTSSSDQLSVLLDGLLTTADRSETGLEILNTAFYRTAIYEPDLTLENLNQLPLTTKEKVANGVIKSLLRNHPDKATEWLTSQPAGPALNEGAAAAMYHYEESDPAGAIKWSRYINQPEKRTKLIEGIIQRVDEDKITEVEDALNTIPLSPDEREKINITLDRRLEEEYSPLILP